MRIISFRAIAVLNHNTPTAYLVSAEIYENMIEVLEYIELRDIVIKWLVPVAHPAHCVAC